jgi:hypothetical protein
MRLGKNGGRVAGRRVRLQIGVEKSDDFERTARIKRLERRLGKLEPREVSTALVEDALNGDLTSMLLVMRVLGVLDEAS